MVKKSVISCLLNPYNGQELKFDFENDQYRDMSGNVIPIINGIPNFLALEETKGLNRKYQQFYDKISKFNDVAERVYSIFYDLNKLRSEWMQELELKEGDNVLETSIGTGWNVKMLPQNANYFGVDISRGMLKQCLKNSEKWQREMELFQANAEYLPFKDETFDSIFHVGGINFFNDRERAIKEMIRVAKPGTKILIIDETEEKLDTEYRRMPFINRYFKKKEIATERLSAPVELVPAEMREIEVKFLDKKMYQLSFRKP